MNYPQRALKFLLDAIFPVRCVECSVINESHLCRKCLAGVKLKKKFECISCLKETYLGRTCPDCLPDCPVDTLFVVVDYETPQVKKLIKCLKYRFVPEASAPLFSLIAAYLKYLSRDRKLNFFSANPLVVPVPLFKSRLNWRGFNQSELLAKKIAEKFLMPFGPDILKRIRKAEPQAFIPDKEKRLSNISGQFICPDDSRVVGARILLIDDVCTSGATLSECARVLKKNGAREVAALVVARG